MPFSLNVAYNLKKGVVMCFILAVVISILAIQNLWIGNWLTGGVQLLIASVFALLIIANIRRTQCERKGSCYHGCTVTNWIASLFKKGPNTRSKE